MAYVGPGFDGLLQLAQIVIGVPEVELCLRVGFGVIVVAYVGPGFDGLFPVLLGVVGGSEAELRPCVGFGVVVAVDV